MNTILKITVMLFSMLAFAGHAEEPAKSDTGVVTKVEKAVVKGAKAAASGVQRGARAAASGVKRGAKAAAGGVETGAKATARVAKRVTGKASPASAPASAK